MNNYQQQLAKARQATQSLRAFADASLGNGQADNNTFAFLTPTDLNAFLNMIADRVDATVDDLEDVAPTLRACK